MAINRTHLPLGVVFCNATGQTGMRWKGPGIAQRILTAICLLIPLVAPANPVTINSKSSIWE